MAIGLRSVALGLRSSPGKTHRSEAFLSRLFGVASLLAAAAFGMVAGGLAEVSSSARFTGSSTPHIPWTGPFALVTGALAVALCVQLASTFVAIRMVRSGEPRRAHPFRVRGLQSGGCVALLGLAAPAVAAATAPHVWHGLIGVALPVVLIGVAASALSLLALRRGRYVIARGACVLTGASLLWGWFATQAPRLIGARVTIHNAAATHAALDAIAIAAGIVLLLVLPAMYLLFAVFARPELEVTE
jgi:cytochrome d ubiquinol oxidase subunit II